MNQRRCVIISVLSVITTVLLWRGGWALPPHLLGLPYQLDGQPTFLESPELTPRYFCECSDVPVNLPLEAENQHVFQLLRGIIGISRDSRDGHYVLKKLSLFQVILADAKKERRVSERIIEFRGKPVTDTADILELESDLPARGMTLNRRTVVKLNRKTRTGSIRIVLWPTADRAAKPQFDHTYSFRWIKV